MKKTFSIGILVFLSIGSLVSIIGKIYFTLNPSNYVPPDFDPYSVGDWFLIFSQTFVMIFFLFIARKVKDKYAKYFWVFLSASLIFGHVKDYIFKGTGELSQIISILESVVIFSVSLMFLFLYQRHKFDLLEGLEKDK